MGIQKKTIICGVFILIMSLCLMVGCEKKLGSNQEINSSKLTQSNLNDTGVISAIELKNIVNGGTVSLSDDSLDSGLWLPKTQKTTLSKVTSWLQKSKLYKGKIPKSKSATFAANIFPSTLYITISGNHKITIQPESYLVSNDNIHYSVCHLTDVLLLNNDNHIIYIQSSKLYDWLINNKWKTEFKRA
jgi:hypothetical protein